MTSEKDYNKHKTEKQLSQLKDRLDKEGVGTHGTSARLLPVLPRLGHAPNTGVIAAGFGHLLLQLDLHQVLLNAPVGDCSRVWNKWEAQFSTCSACKIFCIQL